MFKFNRAKRQPPPTSNSDKPRSRWWRVTDVTLIVFALAAVGYGLHWVIQVNSGYSMTEPLPTHMVRLQIQDASENHKLGKELGLLLDAYRDSLMTVDVVETTRFELRQVANSFIISREEDRTAACCLAQRLGINPDVVEYRPLPGNTSHVSATLVLGSDASSLVANLRPKENR